MESKSSPQEIVTFMIKAKVKDIKTPLETFYALKPSTIQFLCELLGRLKGELISAVDLSFNICDTIVELISKKSFESFSLHMKRDLFT